MTVRTRLVRAGAVGCGLVAVAGVVAQPLLGVGPAYPVTAAVVFAALVLLAVRYVDEHPFPDLGPANEVTLVRAMLVALLSAAVVERPSAPLAASGVVAASAAAMLDGVDGFLARRSGTASPFGAWFDMETDALLVLVLSLLVWQHDKAGAWVVAGGLMRYAFVAARWPLPWMAGRLTPTRRGKTVAVVQMVTLIVALAPVIPRWLSASSSAVALTILTWSFAIDVGRLWRQRAEMRGAHG